MQCYRVKGCFLLCGLVEYGRLCGDHAQGSSDVLGLCLDCMKRRLSVGLWLHWMLLKVLEHLLNLNIHEQGMKLNIY